MNKLLFFWISTLGIMFFCPGVYADPLPDICTPENHRVYVIKSLEQIESGADRKDVLTTLACIAKRYTDQIVAYAAVRVMFHLCEDDHQREQYLLDILGKPTGDQKVNMEAARLIEPVISDPGRRQLLEYVRSGWEKWDMGPALWALIQLGDEGVLHWLESIIADIPKDDVRKPWLEQQALRVRAQHDEKLLLSLVSGNTVVIDRAELVRQGVRNGFSRIAIRTAVKAHLRDAQSRGRLKSGMLRACMETGVFLEEDAREFPEMTLHFVIDEAGGWPVWATLPAKRIAEFWAGVDVSSKRNSQE